MVFRRSSNLQAQLSHGNTLQTIEAKFLLYFFYGAYAHFLRMLPRLMGLVYLLYRELSKIYESRISFSQIVTRLRWNTFSFPISLLVEKNLEYRSRLIKLKAQRSLLLNNP